MVSKNIRHSVKSSCILYDEILHIELFKNLSLLCQNGVIHIAM